MINWMSETFEGAGLRWEDKPTVSQLLNDEQKGY